MTTPPNTAEATGGGSLLDQLIDSLRQDLRESPPKGPPVWPESSVYNTLRDLIHAGDPQNRRLLNEDLCQSVFVCGSKRSGDLALALIRETQKTKAEQAPLLDARLEEAGASAALRLFQAKTSGEVGALLRELDNVAALHPHALSESSDTRDRFRAFQSWAENWRDQMARREAGQNEMALRILLNLPPGRPVPWIDPAEILRQIESASIAAGKPTPADFLSQVGALADKALAARSPAGIDGLLETIRGFDRYQSDPTYQTANLRTQLQGLQDALIAERHGDGQRIHQIRERFQSVDHSGSGGWSIPRSKLLDRLDQIQASVSAPAEK